MPPREVTSFCRICNAMCGLIITVDGDSIIRVRGDGSHPLSRGYCCPKGRALGALHHAPDRLDAPEIPASTDGDALGPRRTATWDELLDSAEDAIAAAIAYGGPDAVGMYLASGSAFDTNGRRAAERFLGALGSRQKYTATTIDTPCKPLVAELVGGWSGLTPIWDVDGSELLLLIGTNPIVSHGHSNAIPDPVARLREFRARGGVLITVDPRRTETAAVSDLHLQIRPGTDHLLLAHLVREVLSTTARIDEVRSRADGVDELLDCVRPFDAARTARLTGVDEQTLAQLVSEVRRVGRLSALTGTGTSMNAVANATEWMLWALHIVTDSSDRPGGMWFNPGYLSQFDTRSWVASDGEPEVGPSSRPELPRRFGEYPCAALVPEIEAGSIRVLIVVGGNPATALPDSARTAAALASLDALIVVDIVETETTALATHVVPAAGQLERADLTWLLDSYQLAIATQSTPAVVPVGADRRPVWSFFAALGDRLGLAVLPRGVESDTATDELLLATIADRSRTDAATVLASRHGTVHSGPVFGWVTSRVLPGGRWRLAPRPLVGQFDLAIGGLEDAESEPLDDATSAAPRLLLQLLPQRRLRTMNSQLRDTASPGGRLEHGSVVLSVADARTLDVVDGDQVAVASQHGSTSGPAEVSESMPVGSVGVPHGWTEPDVSALTSADVDIDPLTGMVLQSGLRVTVARLTPEGATR